MATVLHIQASTRDDESFSLLAAKAFFESYIESHPEDSVRTLRTDQESIPEFNATAVSGKYRIMNGQTHTDKEAETWKAIEAVIEDFKSADKIVISSPMWNFSIPYHLKHYIDVLVQPGYTFSFSPETGYTGLVTGKPAVLILARGGEYAPDSEAAAFDFQRPYLEGILHFIGFTGIDTMVVEPTLQGGPETAEQKLAETISAAREKAKTF